MAFKNVPAPNINNVGVGNVATLKLDTGPTYQKILFNITAAAALDPTDIEAIRVLIDGKVRIEYTCQQLLDLNAFYNRSADVSTATQIQVMLPFFSNQFKDLAYALATGLGTEDLDTLSVEIKIAAAAPATIAITADLFYDTVPQPLGVFLAARKYSVYSGVIGAVQIRDLPKGGVIYTAMHFFKADISKVVIKVNQVEIVNSLKTVLERFQKDSWPFKRVPVSARCTHVDFLPTGNANDVFNTKGATSLLVEATYDTIGNCDVVCEMLEELESF